jgi:hypothetical protein
MERKQPQAQTGLGIALVVLGLLFLLVQYTNFDWGDFAWPFIIIVPGIALLVFAAIGGKGAAPLAVPGSIVTAIGSILWVQNITDRFESWAYAWGLIVAAVGVGVYLNGLWSGVKEQQASGSRTVAVGLLMFLVFGAFFELFIFGDNRVLRNLWPLIMIGAGAYLVLHKRSGSQLPKEAKLVQKDPDSSAGPNAP